jgi:hypothetical protein
VVHQLCGSGSATAAQCAAETRTAWQDEQTAAADANNPCVFTSLVAYEWTSTPNGKSNHHNVIFRTAQVPASPLDSISYPTESALWTGLDQQCTAEMDCAALTIPHNSNMSSGTAFTIESASVPQMQKYQRLAEVYQHKGSSECFYDPSNPTDPSCSFEYLNPASSSDTSQSYVRTALENGLAWSLTNGGANPLALGLVGATDDHNATPGHVKEDDYAGHAGRADDTVGARLSSSSDQQDGSGGLTVAWAEQNTRDAIFAALQRRETYAVSGPRMIVRFFESQTATPCTSDFPQTIIDQYGAVPMGGNFDGSTLAGDEPVFAIAAWPDSAPQAVGDGTTGVADIATVQVIKGHAKILNGSIQMQEDIIGVESFPATGGCVSWTDTGFDPAEVAFYYVRVLQVPTWRWSHFDCQQNPSASGCGAGGSLDVTVQERAWTSPIWFSP